MITRRQLVRTGALGAASLSFIPQGFWRSPAQAAISNDPGFDLAAVNAKHLADGVRFAPFFVKFAQQENLANLWDSNRGDQQVSFWSVRSPNPAGKRAFLPLGDAVSVDNNGSQSVSAILLAPDDANPDVLRHPVGFDWVLDDHHSGNDRDIAYFKPRAPAGYTALGICFNVGDGDVGRYWCVRNDMLRVLGNNQKATVWTDSGSHWSHDGNLSRATLGSSDAAPSGMFLLPNTLIAGEGSLVQPAALIVSKAQVDGIKWLAPGEPPYDPTTSQGDKFSPGISRVMVLPCTAISDPTLRDQATASPFYYIVNRPVWTCTETSSTPAGEEVERSFTIGTSETNSSEFRHATSWTVSTTAGFTPGMDGGASASVSASFTEEFSLTEGHSTTQSKTEETKHIFRTQNQPLTQFWQLFTRISMYRGTGSLLSSIDWGKNDFRMLPK
jgi:hypothetical protein